MSGETLRAVAGDAAGGCAAGGEAGQAQDGLLVGHQAGQHPVRQLSQRLRRPGRGPGRIRLRLLKSCTAAPIANRIYGGPTLDCDSARENWPIPENHTCFKCFSTSILGITRMFFVPCHGWQCNQNQEIHVCSQVSISSRLSNLLYPAVATGPVNKLSRVY